MLTDVQTCPRCGGTEFSEHRCGVDSWDSYEVGYDVCNGCGLWHDENFGYDRWLMDVESCGDVLYSEDFVPHAD